MLRHIKNPLPAYTISKKIYILKVYLSKATNMLKTTLQFNSIFSLWRFKVAIHAQNVVVLAKKNLLICELTETDIQRACQFFAAKVVVS